MPIDPEHLKLARQLWDLSRELEREGKARTPDHMRARALDSKLGAGEGTEDDVGDATTLLRKHGKA